MTARGHHDSADLTDMFHRIFEENEPHEDIVIIIFLEGIVQMHVKLGVVHLVIDSFSSDSQTEITEDQVISALGLEVLGEVELGEVLLNQI